MQLSQFCCCSCHSFGCCSNCHLSGPHADVALDFQLEPRRPPIHAHICSHQREGRGRRRRGRGDRRRRRRGGGGKRRRGGGGKGAAQRPRLVSQVFFVFLPAAPPSRAASARRASAHLSLRSNPRSGPLHAPPERDLPPTPCALARLRRGSWRSGSGGWCVSGGGGEGGEREGRGPLDGHSDAVCDGVYECEHFGIF